MRWLNSGLILGLRPANERRCYKVKPSLIGCAQTENQTCELIPHGKQGPFFSYTVNTISADGPATQEVMASATLLLTYSPGISRPGHQRPLY